MAKGDLRAQDMLNQVSTAEKIDRSDVLILMRKFALQETAWWQKQCDKWEKAYAELLKSTD